MTEEIKKYEEGKGNGTFLQITDDGNYVFSKQEYKLNDTVFPPVVEPGEVTVYFTTTRPEIEAEILKMQSEIDLLINFLK